MNASNQEQKRAILAVLSHPDDETFGMGGTLALYAKRGVDVHLVNIIDDMDEAYFRYVSGERMGNPHGLDGVHNCVLNQADFFANPSHTGLPGLLEEISPDIAIGVDCIPTLMLKNSRPELKVIFLDITMKL